MTNGITFLVETSRVLQLLTREIYDSPLALLRENLQNAYDAVRMRFAKSGALADGGRIDVMIRAGEIAIADNGVGMTEEMLRSNFWRPGSSGKHSEAARRSGVVGTFGIGAMANFGVCHRLTVETRHESSTEQLRSTAELANLKIGEDCITLDRVPVTRDVGTTVTADLHPQHHIAEHDARAYLEPYVALVPVPIYLNDELISCNAPEKRLETGGRSFSRLGTKNLTDGLFQADFEVQTDSNGQALVLVENIKMSGTFVIGKATLLQEGGQLFGLRSGFGLAPVPAIGFYQLGGFADLSFLQPTAGREALNRESIQQVRRLVTIAERAISLLLAPTEFADKNTAFLHWILAHNRLDLTDRVTIHCYPDDVAIEFGQVTTTAANRTIQYYAGNDKHVLATYANERALLLRVSQNNPRRSLQTNVLANRTQISQVPDTPQITHVYSGPDLSVPEAATLIRLASVLRDDYLIADATVALAEISHGVTIFPRSHDGVLQLYIARGSLMLIPLLECYDKAYDVFGQFVKDFVRIHIYNSIQDSVPSSTRDGVDALRKLLQRNRDLYRYEENERGNLEALLGDWRKGSATLSEVLDVARSAARAQGQTVTADQVGSIEAVVPDVVSSPILQVQKSGSEFTASPPILREHVVSEMKLLTGHVKHPQINGFTMLLGLSDRLMRTESEFFRTPHTTRILWGGHRVIYIFTEATGRLNLYYEIELRQPLDRTKTSGGMYPTTTLITKTRIFVPVPESLAEEFRIESGSKEFFVRFDLVPTDAD